MPLAYVSITWLATLNSRIERLQPVFYELSFYLMLMKLFMIEYASDFKFLIGMLYLSLFMLSFLVFRFFVRS